jgi:hypothetical protein
LRTLILDTEVYRDYFLAMFLNVETGKTRAFELYDGHAFDAATVRQVLRKHRVVTFNGNNFDVPLLALALNGADAATIKRACDDIIVRGKRGWQVADAPSGIDHVDLIEVAPGTASLKIYGGRLHCPRLQDLPIEPDASIAPEQRPVLREYCANDLATTARLYEALLPQIELREAMSAEYGIDLRSKSDAQIAEAVIAREFERPEVNEGSFKYKAPGFVRFETTQLQDLLALVQRVEFVVPDSGAVMLPAELSGAEIRLGQSVYRLGIGGLHSSEQSVAHLADGDTVLVDRDVASYYPAIILRCGLAPKHMGAAFTHTYRSIVQRRLEAKRRGDKVTADALKSVVNGSFGKLGSKWSRLYSPDLLIQVTLTGQLCLLMLIEALEAEGIPVVSANTDGIVIKCPTDRIPLMDFVVWEWEQATGFETEASQYRALFSRDVNNYIALKAGGGAKLKGAYAPAGLSKNPVNEVCVEAVVRHLLDGTPVEDTIAACRDIKKFLTLRQVKGGAIDQAGNYLGRAVRWYYATGVVGPLRYRINNYTVARSEGARACMELPNDFPEDVNLPWYVREATSILSDIAAVKQQGELCAV